MPVAIPNLFTNTPAPTTPFALLDADFVYLQAYLNAIAPTSGLLANRPAAGNPGAIYEATDVNGGTAYLDTGSAWIQMAPSVNQQAPTSLPFILAGYAAGSL